MSAGKVAPLIRAGLIAGLVVAGLAYPLAALAGLGVKAGTNALQAMPDELTVVPNAQTTYVYAKDGKTLLTTFYEEYRKQTKIENMSPYITEAIVAAEDTRFYEHHGVDAKGVARAFVANQQAGGVSQGASTLTMQYVRMALRDAAKTPQEALDATEQTTSRKLREMRLAIELEKRISKQEILERYLNAAYFGHRAYGIFAASQIFFSKPPKDLDLNEAALLAGLVKAPSAYDPAGSDQTAATDRRNYVIDQMLKMGSITAAQAADRQAGQDQAAPEHAAERLRRRSPTEAQRLGLLLRLLQDLVARAAGVRRDPRGPRGEPAPRRLPGGHLDRPGHPGVGR